MDSHPLGGAEAPSAPLYLPPVVCGEEGERHMHGGLYSAVIAGVSMALFIFAPFLPSVF